MKLVLKRIAFNPKQTYGVILRKDNDTYSKPLFVTLEDAWNNNASDVSCIPEGLYLCHRITSPHFGEVFEVGNVPNRTHILFHAGNSDVDTHGCILLGTSFDVSCDRIMQSQAAVFAFMSMLKNEDSFSLEIQGS